MMLNMFLAPPTIDRSNLVEIYQVKINQTARLECPMDGKPKPHIFKTKIKKKFLFSFI
jgi:hypothetical protein